MCAGGRSYASACLVTTRLSVAVPAWIETNTKQSVRMQGDESMDEAKEGSSTVEPGAADVAPFPGLVPMMEQAKRDGLWFRSPYQDLWFSPVELEREWTDGKFRWGVASWQLCDPQDRLHILNLVIQHASDEYNAFSKRMENAR